MSRESGEVVRALLAADATQVDLLDAFGDRELIKATEGQEFVLTPEAVAAVLTRYSDGSLSREATQKWASFTKRGHIWIDQPVIDIAYEDEHEDAIVEAIARMDELGDIVDGQIDAAEVRRLLDALERRRQVRTEA